MIDSAWLPPNGIVIPTIISNGEFTGDTTLCVASTLHFTDSIKKEDPTKVIFRVSQTINQTGIYFPGFCLKLERKGLVCTDIGSATFCQEQDLIQSLEKWCQPIMNNRHPFDFQYFVDPTKPIAVDDLYHSHNIPTPANSLLMEMPNDRLFTFLVYNCHNVCVNIYCSTSTSKHHHLPSGILHNGWMKGHNGILVNFEKLKYGTILVPIISCFNAREHPAFLHFHCYLCSKDKFYHPFHIGPMPFATQEEGYIIPYVVQRTGPTEFIIHPTFKNLGKKNITTAKIDGVDEFVCSLRLNTYDPGNSCTVQ